VFIVAIKNFICVIALLVMSPIFVVAAFLIAAEDGFPVFFSQQRIGLHEELFTIYKIRTMKINTPQSGTHNINHKYKLKIGMLLRKIKLDEFPQLVNVIRGELNLVGPRPGLENQTELRMSRFERNIFDVKPGITGLSQILGYDMSNPEQLAQIDQIYILNQTLRVNLLILIGTFFNFPRNYLAAELNIRNLKNNT